MARPGTVITLRDTSPPRSVPTDTGVWFVAGISERGPVVPTAVLSMTDFERVFGARITSSQTLYDALDTFFHEGGRRAYVSRVTGPAPILATKTLLDGSAGNALIVKANGYGAWGNNLSVEVQAGSGGGLYVLVIRYNGVIVETTPDLIDVAAAVSWSATSSYVTITLGGGALDPAVIAAQSLTTGTDDNVNATDATWKAALDKFTNDYGPGQVSYPGRTSAQGHADVLAHVLAQTRIALLDAVDTATKATLKTAVTTDRTANAEGCKFAATFAPWALVPGITPGTTRTVPYSAVQAGIIARNDSLINPNQPSAGENGQSNYAIGLSQVAWSDADRQELNDAGVNVARVMLGGVRTYGYRTMVDPITKALWIGLGGSRTVAAIVARSQAILEAYVFSQIDGQGKLFARVAGDLIGVCQEFYTAGALYGSVPDEAFNVVVDGTNNTPATIAAQELHASLALRTSPAAELVQLDIVKVPVTVPVA